MDFSRWQAGKVCFMNIAFSCCALLPLWKTRDIVDYHLKNHMILRVFAGVVFYVLIVFFGTKQELFVPVLFSVFRFCFYMKTFFFFCKKHRHFLGN